MNVVPVELFLNLQVEVVDVRKHTLITLQVVPVIHIAIHRILNRIRNDVHDHIFCHGNVDGRPYRVGCADIISILLGLQNTILIRLVITGPHENPSACVGIVSTLYDRVGFHLGSFLVHRHITIVDWNVDAVGIRIRRRCRLKQRRNTVLILSHSPQIFRKFRSHILSRDRFTRIQNDITRRSGNKELTCPHVLLQNRIKRRLVAREAKQKVNTVLRRRLPLVDSQPRVLQPVFWRRNTGRTGRKDKSVRLILKLHGQHLLNGRLHGLVVARKEHLGFNTDRSRRW